MAKETRKQQYKNRIGESKVMNCGVIATIIAYRNSGDIDVEFETGQVVYHRTYTNFQRGGVNAPLLIEYIEDYAKCTNLRKGFSFLVDVEDVEKVAGKIWHKCELGYIRCRDGKSIVNLHNLIAGSALVDHIDRDRSNNRKSNLRACTWSENNCNKGKPSRKYKCSSKYKGVTFNKKDNNWRASITVNKKTTSLGTFKNEIDAAKAYNKAVFVYHGEFARPNILDGDQSSL